MVSYSYDTFMESHLGILGWYQLLLITIASLDLITYAFYTLGPVFYTSTPSHMCTPSPVPYNCTQEEWGRWGVPSTCAQDGGVHLTPVRLVFTTCHIIGTLPQMCSPPMCRTNAHHKAEERSPWLGLSTCQMPLNNC